MGNIDEVRNFDIIYSPSNPILTLRSTKIIFDLISLYFLIINTLPNNFNNSCYIQPSNSSCK